MRGSTPNGGRYLMVVLVAVCVSLEGCVGCCTLSLYSGPASALDVRVTVLDLDENPGDGRVPVIIQFLYNGNPVQVDPGITVTCNDVVMPWHGAYYGHTERVPMQPARGTYTVVYNTAGIISNARVTVPERPVFAAPTVAGASLPRSKNFTIRYISGPGNAVLGRAQDATRGISSSQVDDGYHEGLDVSGFAAGPGKLSITRTQEWNLAGSGFRAADATYSINRQISITWLP